MKTRSVLGTVLPGLFVISASAASVNLVVNPNFERTYAAQRLVNESLPYRRAEHRWLPAYAEGVEPFLPYGWTVYGAAEHRPVLALVASDGRTALRIRTASGERMTLRQQFIEIIPGAPYALSFETRGRGRIRLRAGAHTPAAEQELLNRMVTAGEDGSETLMSIEAGPHRRLLWLRFEIEPEADVQLRGVRLDTDLEEPRPSPEDLQILPAATAPNTLFFEDFEGPDPVVQPGEAGRLSEDGAGRRGCGMIVSAAGGGSVTGLDVGPLPEIGTIAFWFKPAQLPAHRHGTLVPLAVTTRTPGRRETQVHFRLHHWLGAVQFGFRKARYAQDVASSAHGTAGWGRWQPGTWHHVAGSWDGEIIRLYVDGVLEGILNDPEKILPHGEAMALVLEADGVYDEIQLIEGLPFGPYVPTGAKAGSYRPPAPPATPEPVAVPELSAEDRQTLRAEALSALPDPDADYQFESAAVQPAWEGMAGLEPRPDYFGPGADAVRVNFQNRIGEAGYWTLEDVVPGEYHLGIWVETGGEHGEYSPPHLNLTAYRNGWPLRFETARDPIQVRPGVWLTEVQTGGPVALREGDEIAFVPHRLAGAQHVYRLALYREAPVRGHAVTGRTFGAADGAPLRLRLVLRPAIRGVLHEGEPLEAAVRVANPLPYAVRAVVAWTLADHFGAVLRQEAETVALDPHQALELQHEFMAEGEAEAYQLTVHSRPADDFVFPETRPEDWLDLYAGVQAEMTPNLPDPLTTRNHVRRELLDVATGFRRRLDLGGWEWERADLPGRRVPDPVPEDLSWRRVQVPQPQFWSRTPPDVFGYVYRRTVTVPADWTGERLLLEFDNGTRGAAEITVFLNGVRIGGGFINLTPLRLPVPPQTLTVGEAAELVVVTRGAISLMHPDFVDRYAPGDIHLLMENQQHPGLFRNSSHLFGPVRLITRPAFAVRQVLPLPDPENERLAVRVRLENTDAEPRRGVLTMEITQNGRTVAHRAAPLPVEVAPGQIREVRFETTVTDLEAYTPLNPATARLEMTLTGPDGDVLDQWAGRFAHRSIRVRGTDLVLNGRPFRFFGYGPNFRLAHILEMENDVRASRVVSRGLHADYDLLGDAGIFNYREMGFAWAQRWRKLNNDAFWEAMQESGVEQVWEYGAQPTLIGWNIANESYHYAPYHVGREGQERHGERIVSLAEAIREATGTDFWFLADGDETLGGRLDFCSVHYLNHWGVFHGFRSNADAFGGGDGNSTYPPDHFFLNRASEIPRPGTEVTVPGPNWIYGSTAFADTESYWFASTRNGVGIAKYIGDAAAVSSALQFYHPRGMAWTKTSMEGYRDMAATGIKGIYWHAFYNLTAQAVFFTLPEMALRYYSGARFDRRVSLFDDEFLPGEVRFSWTLADPDGRIVREGRIEVASDTALLHRDRIAFEVPDVTGRTPFTLRMEIHKDGRRRAAETRRIEVWPPLPPPERTAPGMPRVALYDPAGTTAPLLDRLGVVHTPIPELAAEHLTAHRVLLVGEQAVRDDMGHPRRLLNTFAAGGGRVLLLAQPAGGLLPLNTVLESKLHTSVGFVRMPAHPVMAGLEDADLQFWNPGHVVALGAYHKPDAGAFRALADTGHDGTMAWSLLLECPVGAGTVLASQFALADVFATEPMAAELLRRLLVYVGGPLDPAPAQRLAVLAGATDDLLRRLTDLRVEFDLRAAPDAADSVLLVDLDGLPELPGVEALRDVLEAGATLIVNRVRPEHAEWLSTLSRRPVTVGIQPYAAWADRQMIRQRDGLLTGLNQLDFYWRPQLPGEGFDSQLQISRPPAREQGQVDWIVRMDGVEDDLFPGGLLDLPVGAGRLIVNQVRWTMNAERLGPGSPARILSAILTHLGIARRLPAPRPSLPPGARFEPVDLAALANRSFQDDAAGDGKGWIDWGPEMDLRTFPTGRVTFHGVPFLVPEGEHNALVLRMSSRYTTGLEDLPDTFEIPVHRDRVAGLVFLHTGGWMFGLEPYARREIEYADGSVEVHELNQTNTGDWNPGWENFPDEVGTVTRVAWTGANPQYPVIRVYQTLWVNPHPDKEIRGVRITNAGLGERQHRFLVHMGLSVARRPEDEAAPEDAPPEAAPEGRNAEVSLTLLNEALARVAANEPEAAAERLEAALQADRLNIGAWIALADLRAETAEPDAFRDWIGRWLAVLPDSYQAYNIHAKYLEDRGHTAEALAAYHQSLELEGNQPFTIQAVERLER